MKLKQMFGNFRSDILKQEGFFDSREAWAEAAAYEATLECCGTCKVKVAKLDFVIKKMAEALRAEFEEFALQGADKEAFAATPLGKAFAEELGEVAWEAEAQVLLEEERETHQAFETSESYIIWHD